MEFNLESVSNSALRASDILTSAKQRITALTSSVASYSTSIGLLTCSSLPSLWGLLSISLSAHLERQEDPEPLWGVSCNLKYPDVRRSAVLLAVAEDDSVEHACISIKGHTGCKLAIRSEDAIYLRTRNSKQMMMFSYTNEYTGQSAFNAAQQRSIVGGLMQRSPKSANEKGRRRSQCRRATSSLYYSKTHQNRPSFGSKIQFYVLSFVSLLL